MNRQKMIIASVLFLTIGFIWITTYWKGSVGFSAAHPVAGSQFSMNISVSGWPALGGVAITSLGTILLVVVAVLSVVDIAIARRG